MALEAHSDRTRAHGAASGEGDEVAQVVAPGVLDAVRTADAVTFTSSSTVTGWLELFGRELVPPVVGCIGPITAATARAAGIPVDFAASEHSIPGLVAALVAYAGTAGRPDR